MYWFWFVKWKIKTPDGWLDEGWMTLFVWNSAEAECTVLLPFKVTDMERAKKDSETLCAVFGWLGLRSFFPSAVACNVCSAWLVLPKGHINGGSLWRVVSLFSEKVGKITIRTPNKGPNPTTMDKQITKEFFWGCYGHSWILHRGSCRNNITVNSINHLFFFLRYYHGIE